MPSESTTSNVMLTGQSAYIKKEGSMTNHGVITITDTSSSHTYSNGFIEDGSKINGTTLENTTDYITCETNMKTFLGTHYIEPEEGEYGVQINATNIITRLTEPSSDIQVWVDKII